MEPIRVLNMFTIMNRGGAETMVMNYYRRLDKSNLIFWYTVRNAAPMKMRSKPWAEEYTG